jgi:CRP/FNR family transcriptional regulator, cyclic AMP receptor protein
MTLEEKMQALGAAALFGEFTDTGKRIFAAIAQERRIPAGAPLFVENAAGDSLFVVVAGTVRLTQRRPEGGDREVGAAGPGDQLGELAVLAPGPRLLGAVAGTDCRVLEIGQRAFLALAPQKPQACLKLATAIAGLLARRAGESRDLLREALGRAGPA